MLGAEDTVRRGGFFSSKPSMKNRSTVFTLGQRGTLLAELESPIIVPHTAKDGPKDVKHTYERLFRSIQYAMLDNSAREFLFCLEFFGVKDPKATEFFKALMVSLLFWGFKKERKRQRCSRIALVFRRVCAFVQFKG